MTDAVQDLIPARLVRYTRDEAGALAQSLKALPMVRVRNVDLTSAENLAQAIRLIAEAADAPAHFGGNLDALLDLLDDRPKGDDVFFIKGVGSLKENDRRKLIGVLSIVVPPEESYGRGRSWRVLIV